MNRFAIISIAFGILCFMFGYGTADRGWTKKYNNYLQEQTQIQKEALDAKDKTISIIIDSYNELKTVSDKSSVLVGELQYKLTSANRQLKEREDTKRLSGCQELLSEGIGLLREGQGLVERTAVNK